MSKYSVFRFKGYEFDIHTKTLSLWYGYDDALQFCETFTFDFKFVDYDPVALDRACQLLFFMAGISYYKMYLADEILVESGQVDKNISTFLSTTYQKGLGEFFFVNELDPNTKITFPTTSPDSSPLEVVDSEGLLVGIGGGKDSIVSAEILRDLPKVATWSLNHKKQLKPLIERIGLEHLYVERKWDKQMIDLNNFDALNGHVPISAILACTGAVVGILSGYSTHIVSNESSASEPTLEYQGVEINHQYSKSLEFEKNFQNLIGTLYSSGPWYASLLRPFSELKIAEIFATHGWFEKYKDVFSSCNRAFTHDSPGLFWDGSCPKCAFVFLILTPFVDQDSLQELFEGKNLLNDPSLEETYLQLLGIEGDKPLECVGEVKESRSAMVLSQDTYPELSKYIFDIPADYSWQAWREDSLSDTLRNHLLNKVKSS